MKPDTVIDTVSTLATLAIALSAAAIVIGLTGLVERRGQHKEGAVATRQLDPGTHIAAADIETEATKQLVGRFLTRSAEAGQRVVPSMTSSLRLPERPNTLAALVTIAGGAMALTKDAPVDILRGDNLLASGTVLDWSCGKWDCKVLVGLAAVKAGVDTVALGNARLRPTLAKASGS